MSLETTERGKGFNLVDMEEEIPAVEEINVKISRKILQRRVKYSNFDDEIKELRDLILKIDKKPIVELIIEGKSYNRSLVHENLNKLALISLYKFVQNMNLHQFPKQELRKQVP